MVLYIKENREIYGYNKILTQEQQKEELKRTLCVQYDGDFSFEMAEFKQGFRRVYYLNEDNTIRVEYTERQKVSTLSEIEQAILDTTLNTEYLVCLADLGV